MAKKKLKRIKKKKRNPPKVILITEKQRIEHLIKISEKQITDKSSSVDDLFRKQADRLKKELLELK